MKISKAKEKCDKSKDKAKTKVAKKCSKAKKACACLALLLAIVGCQQVPSRSQTLTVRDCAINIYGCGTDTNQLASIEIGTQAMSIENSGTETQTPTQTTDTKPDIDVTVGGKASGGLLESVTSKLLGSSSSSDATASQNSTQSSSSAASSASALCPGGNCNPYQ